MLNNWEERTQLLLSYEGIKKIRKAKILIVGVGGVGGTTAEFLCRAGIQNIDIVDNDSFSETNLNRQIFSNTNNIGYKKVEEAKKRLLNINPELNINAIDKYVHEDNVEKIVKNDYDIVIDAIDTLSPKIFLILACVNNDIPIISSMGAGGRTDVSKVQRADISKSFNCGLARMVRKRLTKYGIRKGFPVVFSPEDVDDKAFRLTDDERNKKTVVGVISYMPSTFACYISEYVIHHLTK
jgi:tRNA A37 threonylcarbamoyladenosine dehydratase